MSSVTVQEIDALRASSRDLVRRLGFMRPKLAGTDLSPSAVHCIIEVGLGTVDVAADLIPLLGIEKSSVSRLIQNLIRAGYVMQTDAARDRRQRPIRLTTTGREQFEKIEAFGRQQVGVALEALVDADRELVLAGMEIFAKALASNLSLQDDVVVDQNLTPGTLGKIAAWHGIYYGSNHGFGTDFEAQVLGGLAALEPKLIHRENAVFLARVRGELRGELGGELRGDLRGAITVVGHDTPDGAAHIRWFISNPTRPTKGVGRKLLRDALDFVDGCGFKETRLATFAGLDAARHLYESHGFVLVNEQEGDRWGALVREQEFLRPAPSPRQPRV